MNVYLAFCEKDVKLAQILLTWILDFKPQLSHAIVLVADPGTSFDDCLDALSLAKKAFGQADLIVDDKHVTGWIPGSNSLWLKCAHHAFTHNLAHWLFMEPDAVPVKKDWLDIIEADYVKCGKRYSGVLVKHTFKSMPSPYLEGVAVYPGNAFEELVSLINTTQSWVLTTANTVRPQAYSSPVFQHLWGESRNPPAFNEDSDPSMGVFNLNYIRRETALFHRSKDGSLIGLLRNQHGIAGKYPKCYIQLGRNGDLLIVLRALKVIHDITKQKPKLMVSYEYASLLEGVSYVEPVIIREQWWQGIPKAREIAKRMFGGGQVLQCHGSEWGVDMKEANNFQESMWKRTGVPLALMRHTPLVFDQRDKTRESVLRAAWMKPGKPTLLYNVTGVSSPFPHSKLLLQALHTFKDRFNIVDIGRVKAHRIYDLLGLYDYAACLVTTDTATLHLACGSSVPYVALTVGGWNTAVPCGNCIYQSHYADFPANVANVIGAIAGVSTVLTV